MSAAKGAVASGARTEKRSLNRDDDSGFRYRPLANRTTAYRPFLLGQLAGKFLLALTDVL